MNESLERKKFFLKKIIDSAKTSKKPIEKPVEKPVEKIEVEVPKVEEIIEEKVEEIIEDLVKHSEKNAKPKENVDQVVEEIEVIIVNPIETDIKGVDQVFLFFSSKQKKNKTIILQKKNFLQKNEIQKINIKPNINSHN